MELNKKQLGTLIASLNHCLGDCRERVKRAAKATGTDHLNDINAELKLLMKLSEEYKTK